MNINGSEQAQYTEISVRERGVDCKKASTSDLGVLHEAWQHFTRYRVFPGMLE